MGVLELRVVLWACSIHETAKLYQYDRSGVLVEWVSLKRVKSWGWIVGLLVTATPAVAQVEESVVIPDPPTEASSPMTEPSVTPATGDGLYFADVVVRGRPIFQIGSLADISATQRAEIINRRIASILSRVDDPGSVEVQTDAGRGLATLRLNNRVLMTVTEQDAEDFGLTVEELAQEWATRLNQALDRPPLAVDVARRLDGTIRDLMRDAIAGLPAFIGALIVVLLTWAAAAVVRHLAFRWAQRTDGDRSTEVLIGRLGYGGVWVLGSIIALGLLGLNFGTLLGALGLTSVAIGFSLKDVLSNYISGVILLAARPFRLGDQVVIREFEGTIIQIQLRATTMNTYDGRTVYIPNQEVFQASVTNNTASPRRRSSLFVGIDYDAAISQAIQVIRQAVAEVEQVEKTPVPEVLVIELGASTVNLEVRFWVDSKRAGFLDTTSRVAQSIKESLQRAEVDMPTEIYTLMFRNAPPGLREAIEHRSADIVEAPGNNHRESPQT